ncbi:hypothetical protein [Streptomyces sp. NPDC016845]|uniref:hypothetical protein n=1 Tax=Streptomyces sp. NPDC016845 TaxID=3364972 RepID=UPI00378CAF67
MSTDSNTSRTLYLDEFGPLPRLGERAVPEPRPGHELPFISGTQGSGYVIASDTHPEGALVRLRREGLGLSREGAWAEHVL